MQGPRDWLKKAGHAARWIAPVFFFCIALWGLHRSLREYSYADIAAAFGALTLPRLALSVAITACGYLVLAGYDILAFRYIGRRLRLRDFGLTSFMANALGNSAGNVLVTGAAVRYWIYTSLGVSAAEITKVVIFCSVGFWLGFLLLASLVFLAAPISLPVRLGLPMATTAPLGVALLVLLGTYLALVARKRPLKLRQWAIALPSPTLTLGQLAVAWLDLSLMAAALYVLFPEGIEPSFGRFMCVFLVALVLSTLSQVPGGLGVFETVVLLLSPNDARAPTLAALVAFRGLYFILPLLIATASLGLWHIRARLRTAALVPDMTAAAVFLCGVVLLASGVLPAAAGRLAWLHKFLTLPVIEISHFAGSVIGTALLFLAPALRRRINAAYLVTLALLALGIVASLTKGWDYEEVMVLGSTLILLLPLRRHFYRQGSLLAERFTARWTAAVIVVFTGCAALGFFAFSHPEYADASWWSFSLAAEASRALRATVAAATLGMVLGAVKLLRPARPVLRLPTSSDFERARRIIESSGCTYPNLAYRGDKALLFSEAGHAMLMYGHMGRSWIVMGDPVGPEDEVHELLRGFRAECDRFDGWIVVFEARAERLPWYEEVGLGFTKIGEEARVDLASFDLQRPELAGLRQKHAKLLAHACRFEILQADAVPQVLGELERVSDAWLSRKRTHEKNFSTASFDEAYLARFPIAIVRRNAEIIAFANLWQSSGKEELSVDLMRHLPQAPNGTMDFLFTELLLWGRQAGYRWFNFGMAPLSGLDARKDAPLWHRLGTLVYRHGEHFYNFRGLRAYKEKFRPVWTPLYLASPGGAALPAILLDVTALIAGGYAAIVSKRAASA
ncbi:MAG TPA: bifunctional lysylphosphatidylglycerol flippase/synthetase MprF [Burkholderiales bacterium]|nr:bifunctional lysylphosphatidylglycerol flippase/synthetase MprF [Burkholderiales bacterium]